mmetsp:Transcript_48633/g.157129  ORF Transcript_48633/g.157129 Transcript_48633/m.157129 type:complete len:199 (+) Transcript_48633:57-653(+)
MSAASKCGACCRSSRSLEKLNLGRNPQLGDAAGAALADALQANAESRLRELHLNGTRLGPAAGACLAALVRTNSSLEFLNPSDNPQLGDAAGAALAEALQANAKTKLCKLWLDDTGLGPLAGASFAALLRTNRSLEWLNLHTNSALGDAAGVALAGALRENTETKLRTLKLKDSDMGSAAREAIEELKRTRPQIDVTL